MSSTLTRLLIHIVFGTRDRMPLVVPEVRGELYEYIRGIVHRKGASLFEIGGMPDHVHLLIQIDPTQPLSDLVQHIKGGSSRWIKAHHRSFYWQRGYGAFSVSESNRPVVERYIQNQEKHHARHAFQSEFIQLLRRHGVPYEEEHLWD